MTDSSSNDDQESSLEEVEDEGDEEEVEDEGDEEAAEDAEDQESQKDLEDEEDEKVRHADEDEEDEEELEDAEDQEESQNVSDDDSPEGNVEESGVEQDEENVEPDTITSSGEKRTVPDQISSGGEKKDDGDDEKQKMEIDKSDEKGDKSVVLGGSLEKEAYALLTGQYEDTKESKKTIVHVPITALPAILGRTQKTSDQHIFDLGNCKALSRKHAVIFYSDCFGGKLGKYSDKNKADGETIHKVDEGWFHKQPPLEKMKKKFNIIRPKGVDLPQTGFYAIECISKNKMFVNRTRVEQGQVALLSHGATIRMAGYCLYFLLPEDISSRKIITLPHPTDTGDQDSDDDASNVYPNKKLKREITPAKNDLFEGKTLADLLEEFIQAVDNDIFERKHSLMSSSIMFHAVQDVARSKEMQNTCKEENGVSRTQIMDWIGKNKLYEQWVIKLLTKLEMKSYQANLSKALIKAGFTRIGTTGRHVKWVLPPVKTITLDSENEGRNESQDDHENDEDSHAGKSVSSGHNLNDDSGGEDEEDEED